jgi:hypothetical protein
MSSTEVSEMRTALPDISASSTEPLLEEIERYLAAVELFRAEGCEPRWTDVWSARQLADGSEAG